MFTTIDATEMRRGQTVIVYARWLLVLVGLLVTVWNPDALPQLRLQIGVVLTVAVANFVMHAQLLRHRPTMHAVALGASLGDLLVISLLVASQGGFNSNTFVFFFPAVLAIAVAFPTREAALLSCVALLLEFSVSASHVSTLDVVLERVIAIGAVAVIGNAYWRLHRSRIVATTSGRQQAAQDLFWGQLATLFARWAIVLGGAVLVLARATTTEQLAIGIVPVVLLLVLNFYLHGRYLLERPANASLTLLATGLDLGLLVALFLVGPGAGGSTSPLFVLLYPLVFGVGLVFVPRTSWAYTLGAVGVYAALVIMAGGSDPKTLVVRLITLGAMGGLGSLYWRIVRSRDVALSESMHDTDPTLAWQPAHAG